jgi:hypothetical protein
MSPEDQTITEIPLIDIRQSSLVQVAKDETVRGRLLINASKESFGWLSRIASHLFLPLGDSLAKWWLKKTDNPYKAEINGMAKELAIKGVHALNLSYEWGCTSGAYQKENEVVLVRVLDWPFPSLGECTVVAHMNGTAGDFYNVTWPGFAGVMNGLAPNRFAASINQAPMERHAGGIISDWVHNRVEFHKSEALPPAHLLRQVFETAASYDEAKELLSKTPVSVPVIYTLAGTKAGEGCVIERLENDFAVRELAQTGTAVSATNHFQTVLSYLGSYWMERSNHSHERYEQSKSFTAEGLTKDFNWFSYPVANEFTRLVMTANAKTGALTVMGTAGAVPTTQVFKL